jgi:transglutaminase-like putative cysteine protease
MTPGHEHADAVCRWVRANVEFRAGTSTIATSALETLEQGVGVCRDFVHLAIALLRGLNYPARFVSGVDYGAPEGLGPPDFHSYVEAYIGERWWLFDPTGITPLTGLIRIGTGRDAADVAFATMFGNVRGAMPKVTFAATDDAAAGVVLPQPTNLAVSTASL